MSKPTTPPRESPALCRSQGHDWEERWSPLVRPEGDQRGGKFCMRCGALKWQEVERLQSPPA
jgi:hypothetical protein